MVFFLCVCACFCGGRGNPAFTVCRVRNGLEGREAGLKSGEGIPDLFWTYHKRVRDGQSPGPGGAPAARREQRLGEERGGGEGTGTGGKGAAPGARVGPHGRDLCQCGTAPPKALLGAAG